MTEFISGAEGVGGCALIITELDEGDVHPGSFLTVKVYVVPAVSPVTVVLVPVPFVVAPPGDLVRVHVPDGGRPLRSTLPVDTVQVGCVIVPTTGAVGVAGCALITAADEAGDTQPMEFVTVKL
jgi:hypothetical protein